MYYSSTTNQKTELIVYDRSEQVNVTRTRLKINKNWIYRRRFTLGRTLVLGSTRVYGLNTSNEVEFPVELRVYFYNNDIGYRVDTTCIHYSAKYEKTFDKVRMITETRFFHNEIFFFRIFDVGVYNVRL